MKGKNNSFKRHRDIEVSREKESEIPTFQLDYKMGAIIPCWVVIGIN